MGNEVAHIHHVIHDEFDPHFCKFLHPKLLMYSHVLETSETFREAFWEYFISGAWTLNHYKCPRLILQSMNYILPTGDTLAISEQGSQSLYIDDEDSTALRSWKQRSGLAKAMVDIHNIFPLYAVNALMQFIQSQEYHRDFKATHSHTLGEKFRRNTSFMLHHPLQSSQILTQLLHEDHEGRETVHHSHELDDIVVGLQKEFTMPRISTFLKSKSAYLSNQNFEGKFLNFGILRSVLELLDNFPVSLAISTTRAHRHHNYPFVFVNKAFEKLTQFKREEILGHSWSFMQSEEYTEMNQDHSIRDSLRELLPARLVITNVRKDGTPFTNLLALEPIVSYSHQTFIIGIQYELNGNEKNLKYDLQVIEDVIKLVSGILAC